MLGELFRGCGLEGIVLGSMCTVLLQCASLGGTRDGCRGCPKEAVKAGEEAVAHAYLRGPPGTPYAASRGSPRVSGADLHGHTQRMRERPGPWPRALPATNELR